MHPGAVHKGYPSTSTSISGGDTITQTIIGYNTQAESEGVTTTITGTDAALLPANGFTETNNYNSVGQLTQRGFPTAGGLPDELMNYGLDPQGNPLNITSFGSINGIYLAAVGYDTFNKPLQ